MPPLPYLDQPAVLWTLEVLWVGGVTLWLLHDRRSPAATLAWILVLALLPGVGVPVYALLGPRRLRRRNLGRRLARERAGPFRDARDTAAERLAPEWAGLVRLACTLQAAPAQTARSVRLLSDGDETFDALVEAVGAARDHVHLEYYIFRPDAAGARVRDALAERARAGVAVRLLVDAAGSASLSDRFLAPLLRAGGEVARFNGSLLGRGSPRFLNFRTHRKVVVVDGQVGFTGGANVCDDHSRRACGERAWRDSNLRIEGNAVHGLQLTFLEDWAFCATAPLPGTEAERRARWFPVGPRGPETVQVLASGPDQAVPAYGPFLMAALGLARRRAWLTTPYFVPDEPLQAAIADAARRGVSVRLLLPERTDSRLVDAACRTYLDALLEAGVEVAFLGPPMLHAKTAVFDDALALVGSANLDARSLRLNFEVVAAAYGGALPGQLAAGFEAAMSMARRCEGRERDAPWPRRLAGSAARLLASQL